MFEVFVLGTLIIPSIRMVPISILPVSCCFVICCFVELQVLHVSRELPVSITLQNILSKVYPDEYAARAAEVAGAAAAAAAAAAGGGAERLSLPLFVMSMLLPGEKMALNIFEPR
jgi:hypothetical protein